MDKMTFEELLEINCFSDDSWKQREAGVLLERYYGCEIHCAKMDKSVRFAHHGRGCTIVAAKLCQNVIIYQNVTLGSNMKYNKVTKTWENVGSPILDEGVIVSDGAKILGPVIIGKNTIIGSGAIVTKNIPANCIVYGVNQYKPKDPNYDYVFNQQMISGEEIMQVDELRVKAFDKEKK